MFQFWRCRINPTMHHPIGRAVAELSLFGERSYYALSSTT